MIIYRWCLASLLIFSWAFPAVFAIPLFVAYGKFPAIGLVWIFAQDPMRTVAEFVLTSAEHPSTKVKRRLAHISGQSNKHFLFPVFWCGTKIIQNHPRSSTIIQYHPRPSKFIQDHPNSSKIIQTPPRSCVQVWQEERSDWRLWELSEVFTVITYPGPSDILTSFHVNNHSDNDQYRSAT